MFECLETPSLIMERYETEGNLMVNRKEDSIDDRADLPYEQRMKLLHEQRMGELKKARSWKMVAAAGLLFVILLAIRGIFPQIEIAYVAGALILAGVTLVTQGNYALIGIINSRMEVLATENASRNSTQSSPRERCEKSTWRTRRR